MEENILPGPLELPSRPNEDVPPLCWEDAVMRSKTIFLDDKYNKDSHSTRPESNVEVDLDKYYLSVPLPRPPLVAPFRGEVTWQCNQLNGEPDPCSDLLILWIIPNDEYEDILRGFPPLSQWKFDVILSYLTVPKTKKHSNTFTICDKQVDEEHPMCLKIKLSSYLPRRKSLEDLTGHKLKVSANGVFPLRFYLINTVISLGSFDDAFSSAPRIPSTVEFCESHITIPEETVDEIVNRFVPSERIAELHALVHPTITRATPRSTEVKRKSPSPKSTLSLSRELPAYGTRNKRSYRATGAVRGAVPNHPIPPAQKSFQKLLQTRLKSKYDLIEKTEKDEVGIRVLTTMSIKE